MTARQDRIRDRFAISARRYDGVGDLQWRIAEILAERISSATVRMPRRILEIGCGTGFLSARLAESFPGVALTLSDIAPAMLELCRARLGDRHDYRIVDGEAPQGLEPGYDLIVSSLVFQWFADLPSAVDRLKTLLAPGGKLIFATLGQQTFREWRAAHDQMGLRCGTPDYPGLGDFPWLSDEQMLCQHYTDGLDFVTSLKTLGAGEPKAGYRPLAAGSFRRILAQFQGGATMTYHLLFGDITA